MCVCVHAQGVRGGGLDLWACRLVTKKAPEEKQRRGRGRGSGRKVFLQKFFFPGLAKIGGKNYV